MKKESDQLTVANIIHIIELFIQNKSYGEVIIKIEAGKIVCVKKTETLK